MLIREGKLGRKGKYGNLHFLLTFLVNLKTALKTKGTIKKFYSMLICQTNCTVSF